MSENLSQRIEVLLFMSREALSLEALAEFLNETPETIAPIVEALIKKYSDNAYGIQIINVSNGFIFATKSEYAKTLDLYINAPREVTLSTAAMETLVIIAYRQPISRTEVEAIRGVNSDGIMKSLQDKGLIEEKGKSDAIGHPTLYGTTDAFQRHFGLKDLSELPQDPQLKMQNSKNPELEKFHKALTEKLNFSPVETVSATSEN